MNTRIKELMEKAFQEHYGDPVTPGAREKALELVGGWGEVFAELLIKECSAINTATCKELKADESIKTPGFNTLTNLYMLTLRNKLAEHFGVE